MTDDALDDDGKPARSRVLRDGRWVAIPVRDPAVIRLLETRDPSAFCPQWKPAGRVEGDDMDAVAAAKRLQAATGLRVRAVRREVLFDSRDDGGPSTDADLPPAGMMDLWLESLENVIR